MLKTTMKVLWFANSPCNALNYYGDKSNKTGTWLSALDRELQAEVELTIVYFGRANEEFRYLNTNYISLKRYASIRDYYSRFVLENPRHNNLYQCIISRVAPDVIHIHGTEGGFLSIIGKTDIPIVISIQGILTVYEQKYFSGLPRKYHLNYSYTRHSIKSLLFNIFQSSYSRIKYGSIVEKYFLKRAKHIIGRTKWDERVTRILAPQSTYYHCDEMLRDEFYHISWNKLNSDSTIRIFTTSSNVYYKGIETVVECSNILSRNGVKHKWYLAGLNINDSIFDSVKKYNSSLTISNLVLLGNYEANELIEQMLMCDLYVLPSHIENSPNSLCEAMLLGMPCIATHSGGVSSLISDGQSGVLIQSGDPWVMAGAILEVSNNRSLKLSISQGARRTALLRHNKSKILADLMIIYSNITNGIVSK